MSYVQGIILHRIGVIGLYIIGSLTRVISLVFHLLIGFLKSARDEDKFDFINKLCPDNPLAQNTKRVFLIFYV